MAYTVEQGRQEIGIRLALGAEPRHVRNVVVRQGMSLALAGVATGLGAAWGLTRLLASFLFGVRAHDPIAFVAVPALLSIVALAAVYLPANGASRINPTDCLRYE
jgi:putative ABC transport system permease protein